MPVITSDNILVRLLDSETGSNFEPRIGVMFGILFISLLAVSFPGISKQIPFLRIPHIIFFIGKHFGTGVILSTAFCHLLPDAFDSLQDPTVKEKYHGIGKWTGMIILGSLLSIFLVEYISTSYVDHLHAEPSAPPSPITSQPSSRPQSLRTASSTVCVSSSSQEAISSTTYITEASPLPSHAQTTPNLNDLKPIPRISVAATVPTETTPLVQKGPKRTKSLCNLSNHADETLLPLILLNSPRLSRGGLPHSGLIWGRDLRCICPIAVSQSHDLEAIPVEEEEAKAEPPKIGRRRQVVGILVLQLGIMIHSLVIGLTLAVTSGSDFASLVTAIIFHQLFEGLSLGIRIAALPPSPSSSASWKGNWLKPTLSILFAITTPLGMTVGLWAFPPAHADMNPDQIAHMALTQGLLSAVSAGMLIYAATVEMLAGDFVFGDVGGDHGHTHDHNHEHGHDHTHGGKSHSSIWKRALAVLSLLGGVAGMGLVGLGE